MGRCYGNQLILGDFCQRQNWPSSLCALMFWNEMHYRLADEIRNRARQLYKNISMLFLFPVKTVSLVQGSIHNVSYISLQ